MQLKEVSMQETLQWTSSSRFSISNGGREMESNGLNSGKKENNQRIQHISIVLMNLIATRTRMTVMIVNIR